MNNEDAPLDEVAAEMAEIAAKMDELVALIAYLRGTTPAAERARLIAKS